MTASTSISRRRFLQAGAAGAAGLMAAPGKSCAAEHDRALVAITLDLEMSRNFPTWETTHWDYDKGGLNDETKRYAVEAARRVKAAGGVLHFFALGRTLEQENVDWLKEIAAAGHPIGNHTYDHVNVTATKSEEVQFRFQRAPWLLRGMAPAQAIRENVALGDRALRERLGIKVAGFRTPGGFANGLKDQPAVRAMLLELGYDWVSSLYPPHSNTAPMQQPLKEVIDGIVAAQDKAQPFVYPDGLVEVPMSPISDIGAFRNGRWKLEWFLQSVQASVERAIERRAVFDFLAHPSCLYVVDPEFRAIDLICRLVKEAGGKAALVDLNAIARQTLSAVRK